MTLGFSEIVCGYGDTVVIRGASGQVRAGEALAVIGRNGVGKSTLLKALAGQLPLMGGRVEWNGRVLDGQPLHARLGFGIAYAPQENVVFGELTVAENLSLHLSERSTARYAELFELFPILQRRLNQRAGSLSGGERKLLSFTRTLGLRAKLTMLDEPSEGVQPENIDRMAAAINRRKRDGDSFFIVEQNLELVAIIADSVMVLDHREVVLEGRYAELGRERIERHLVV